MNAVSTTRRSARRLLAIGALTSGLLALGACDPMNPTEPGNLVPKTVAEDASLPAITINGTRLHAQTFGNPANPVIIFLHGGPGGDYRSLLRMAERYSGYSLTDNYFLVFWDQRGAGLSERQNRHVLTIDQYDADLAAIADRYSPTRPVILIGHSWGGMFATEFINRHPSRVAGAVLIESGPLTATKFEALKGELFDMDLRQEWLNDVAWSSQFISPDGHARMDFDRMIGIKVSQPRYHEQFDEPSPSWRLGAAANRYIQENAQDMHGRFNFDWTSNLASFTRPVLFIAGSRSEIIGPSLQQEQVTLYPHAELRVIEGAGHDVDWTHTSEVIANIRTYLSNLTGGAQ